MAFLTSTYSSAWTSAWSTSHLNHLTTTIIQATEAQGSWLFRLILGMIGNARREQNFYVYFFFNAKSINKLCITAYSKLAKANCPFAFPRSPFYTTTSLGDNLVDPCLFSRLVLSKRIFCNDKNVLSLLSNMAATSLKWLLVCSYYN